MTDDLGVRDITAEKVRLADNMVLYVMRGNKGDIKQFRKDEINGGVIFPDHIQPNDPHVYPLKCLTIYVKGTFENWLDGKYFSTRKAGEVADRIRTETWKDCYTKIVEDGSIYFCIYKTDALNKFIHRRVIPYNYKIQAPFDQEVIVCDIDNPYVIKIPKNTSVVLPRSHMLVLTYIEEEAANFNDPNL